MVGAKGFEPSTSWSRTKYLDPINALSGVAYGTRSVISPLSVVRKLSVEFLQLQFQALRSQRRERLPSKRSRHFQRLHPILLTTNVSNKSGHPLSLKANPSAWKR
jgi:hypothetical protein